MAAINTFLLSFALFLAFSNIPFSLGEDKCIYAIYVKTETKKLAGTDSKISVNFTNNKIKEYVDIPDLEKWGLMEPGHNYFEKGNLDFFGGVRPCLSAPICLLNLTSSGTGKNPGWYCDYVNVTALNPQGNIFTHHFKVDRWLAVDEPPHSLTAIINNCIMDFNDDDKKTSGGIQSVVDAAI